MAASDKTGVEGHKCEFVQPYTEDFICKICKYVARECNITTCCGETFCQACITQVLEDKKPCPSCQEGTFTTFQNVKYQRRILALEVYCTMKDRGCNWRGKLEHLEAHLDTNAGECEHVHVECPNKCKQAVEKCKLSNHLANECPKRDFYCQYCNFRDTYEVVCDTHWSECKNCPVQCPNACMVGAVERGDLDDHLKQCSLQEVDCEFSYAGCDERLERQHMERHMQKSTQKHLAMMSAATLRMSREFEQKLQEQGEEFRDYLEWKERETAKLLQEKDEQMKDVQKQMQERDERIRAVEEQLKQRDREIQQQLQRLQHKDEQIQKSLTEKTEEKDKELEQKLQEKDEKIAAVQKQLQEKDEENETKIIALERQFQEREKKIDLMEKGFGPIIPVVLTVPNATRETQSKGGYRYWDSQPMSTHYHGYELFIRVYYNMYNTHVGVSVHSVVGKFDDQLKWPASCTITIQLLNQHQDKDHITASERHTWDKPTHTTNLGWIKSRLHPVSELGWNARKQTQYLKDDCLKINVSEIEIHCN